MKKKLFLAAFSIVFISCKKDSCDDGELNQDEAAIDCGGICTPCPSCSDGLKNQDEVEIDCGGICNACDIYYPESGTYGTNILNGDSINLSSVVYYSMRAEIPEGSTLKIIMYNVSGGGWGWFLGTNTNCIISNYTSSQTFEAVTSGIMQVQIGLNGTGTALIQYFENSTTETKTKTISW